MSLGAPKISPNTGQFFRRSRDFRHFVKCPISGSRWGHFESFWDPFWVNVEVEGTEILDTFKSVQYQVRDGVILGHFGTHFELNLR